MTQTQLDISFFDELEAAAKKLTVAPAGSSNCELQKLFDQLKDSYRYQPVPPTGNRDRALVHQAPIHQECS
jgi:hypothetical protein